MSSGIWGLGSPAGEQGTPVRGTVGTVAPAGRLSPLVRATSYAYTAAALVIAIIAFALLPWGLLLLPVVVAFAAAAVLLRIITVGLSVVEEDEFEASVGEVVRNSHAIGSVGDLGEHFDSGPERVELGSHAEPDLRVEVTIDRLPDDVLLPLQSVLDRRENVHGGVACGHGDTVQAGEAS